jgi:uncharacterized protein YjbI with pentapeptide repeats
MKTLKSHLPAILKISFIALPTAILLILLIQRFGLGMTAWADWTGLGPVNGPVGVARPAKTLWDFVQLLVIPVVLSLGVLYFNQQERKTERKMTEERAQEAALQNYLDRLSELILTRGLLEEEKSLELADASPVHHVAQVRTITILRQLDTRRQNIIFQFLRDTNLAASLLTNASLLDIDLHEAHIWNINFSRSSLIRAKMNGASLYGADLSEAKLIDADLSKSNLLSANLSKALFIRGNLTGANLTKANLTEANLTAVCWDGANLEGADLTGAYILDESGTKISVSEEQLQGVRSLRGAIMPDGTVLL